MKVNVLLGTHDNPTTEATLLLSEYSILCTNHNSISGVEKSKFIRYIGLTASRGLKSNIFGTLSSSSHATGLDMHCNIRIRKTKQSGNRSAVSPAQSLRYLMSPHTVSKNLSSNDTEGG